MRARLLVSAVVPATLVLGAAHVGAACAHEAAIDPVDASAFDVPAVDAHGVFVSKAEACERYVAAMNAKAAMLHCSLDPSPTCPDVLDAFEAASFPGKCLDGYDLGAVYSCVKLIETYASCGDFTARSCALAVRECRPDAGPDTKAVDTAPLDAGDEGGG